MLTPTSVPCDPPVSVQRRPPYTRFLGTLLTAVLIISVTKFWITGQPPFVHRENVWSIALYSGRSPLSLEPTSISNAPILRAADVHDVDALFVADPFLVHDDAVCYLFMEVLNRATHQGDIGVAISRDQGASWQYQQIILDEQCHLSYPTVFQWDQQWYMVPQSDDGVVLYRADVFPWKWQRVATLLEGNDRADPTLFFHEDSWWMFVGRSGFHDRLQLYFADHLTGPWCEHPQSPLVVNNPDIARPGGSVLQFDGNLYRFGQDCAPKYGNQLRAFRMTCLNRQHYNEEPIEGEFVLRPGTHRWNSHGMHHLDAHQREDGSWYALVDGHRKSWTLSWTP